MSIEEAIVEKLRGLPPEKQREVLDFVSGLSASPTSAPRRSLEGLWADLNVHISAEDIDQARREMWGNFPREDI